MKKRVIAFGLASIGEFQFFEMILKKYNSIYPHDNIYIVHCSNTFDALQNLIPNEYNKFEHISMNDITNYKNEFDIYLMTEQF